jgi:hypothetical protein
MRKKSLLYSVALFFAFCGIQPAIRAQDANNSAASPKVQPVVGAYHLDFSIDELENGKKINSRKYSMNLTEEGKSRELKIGTRVPIESDGKVDYLDVGTLIAAQMVSWQTPLSLDVVVNISSFASPDEATRSPHPLLRHVQISARTPVIFGKAIVVGSADDPNSNRQFQLEVTVTKLQ